MRIRLTPQAADDLEQTHGYYGDIAPEVADRFLEDVDRVIERLEMFPDGAPPVEGLPGVRRARMRRHPYGIFYRRDGQADLLVLRVLHSRRGPSNPTLDPPEA